MELFQEERTSRIRRKQSEQLCPVCKITIRPSEIEQHLSVEVDRLNKLSITNKNRRSSSNLSPKEAAASSSETSTNPDECWATYQKIKNNRQTRLKLKTRKRKAEDNVCPVCNERISDDISIHVELCLKKNENNRNGTASDDDESIDIENESFEEYEWAGQTRIRASSLLDGGYSAVGIGSTLNNSNNNQDDDEELIVDGDDAQIYGQAQYNERDIIPISNENKKEQINSLYLRDLIIGPAATEPKKIIERRNSESGEFGHSSQIEKIKSESTNNHKVIPMVVECNGDGKNNQQIIESLKAKIREYEQQIKNKGNVCIVCMDDFKIPVVSICCWHVHCEECWLRTLGARKLCPQCNMITSSADLRRIYM